MRAVVDGGEVLKVQAGVDLGCGDVLVAEEFLRGAEVAAGLQEVRGARVTQGVRRNPAAHSGGFRPLRQARLDGSGAKARAGSGDEKRLFAGAGEGCAGVFPFLHRVHCGFANRGDASPSAFAASDLGEAGAPVNVAEVQRDEFADAQGGGV